MTYIKHFSINGFDFETKVKHTGGQMIKGGKSYYRVETNLEKENLHIITKVEGSKLTAEILSHQNRANDLVAMYIPLSSPEEQLLSLGFKEIE